jgi:hypothetical protein
VSSIRTPIASLLTAIISVGMGTHSARVEPTVRDVRGMTNS